jgi:hypothetical protein
VRCHRTILLILSPSTNDLTKSIAENGSKRIPGSSSLDAPSCLTSGALHGSLALGTKPRFLLSRRSENNILRFFVSMGRESEPVVSGRPGPSTESLRSANLTESPIRIHRGRAKLPTRERVPRLHTGCPVSDAPAVRSWSSFCTWIRDRSIGAMSDGENARTNAASRS